MSSSVCPRQTQGFAQSIPELARIDLPVPDFSTFCRRGRTLRIQQEKPRASGPITLIVDSTGLRVHGDRDWMREKHGASNPRKTWRKLHIGIDADGWDIVARGVTTEHVGDPSALQGLYTQVDAPVARFLADGAYDSLPVEQEIQAAMGADVEIVIPPPKNAVASEQATARDHHIKSIKTRGRVAWQKETGTTQRSRVEAQIGRYKQVIGPALRERHVEAQTTKTDIAVKALNRMTRLGRAVFERVS